MPAIVDVTKLDQRTISAPAEFKRLPDGSAPACVAWRAVFTDDTGFRHFEALYYLLCETPKVEVVSTATGEVDENGDAVLAVSLVEHQLDSPAASALLAQGLVDEAVAADIARVKAALEDPSSPVGNPA